MNIEEKKQEIAMVKIDALEEKVVRWILEEVSKRIEEGIATQQTELLNVDSGKKYAFTYTHVSEQDIARMAKGKCKRCQGIGLIKIVAIPNKRTGRSTVINRVVTCECVDQKLKTLYANVLWYKDRFVGYTEVQVEDMIPRNKDNQEEIRKESIPQQEALP